MTWFISADELEELLMKDILLHCEHMGWNVNDNGILDNHSSRRPLEQTIRMIMMRIYFIGIEEGKQQR